MNKTAIITLSDSGARLAGRLAKEMPGCDLFLHESVSGGIQGRRLDSIRKLTRRIFKRYREFVFIMPCGVVVRALDGLPEHKTTDPAVVVVDAGGRYAISLLSGHEGGANALALRAANILGAEPVITTTTEALKDIIIGIGCRRNAKTRAIVRAVKEGLNRAGVPLSRVRLLASADIKKNEPGLLAAAAELDKGIRFIPSAEILATTKTFKHSKFVTAKVGLPAVAEPAALLAGRRTRLILKKNVVNGVTVAVARENYL